MRYWAEIQNGIVVNVILAEDITQLSLAGEFLETWPNGESRKNYGGIGYSYNKDLDAFIAPKCHSEATLNQSTCRWDCLNEAHTTLI